MVSVVIVSWNAKDYLAQCLESLATIRGSVSLEVFVVDNASADGSPEMVRERFPSVRLMQTGANLGFAKANNMGIRQCKGRYVCLVNSDIKVLNQWDRKSTRLNSSHANISYAVFCLKRKM